MSRCLGRVGVNMSDFSGNIKMFNKAIFINKKTGEGYQEVLESIDPLICGWASRVYMPGYTFEDIKQDLIIIAIEGINSYDHNKGVKLSSFLTTHIRNKLISKLKSVNKLSNDASMLRSTADTCSCEDSDQVGEVCNECGLKVGSKYRSSKEEFSFSLMDDSLSKSGDEEVLFQNSISNSDSLYSSSSSDYDISDISIILEKLKEDLDEKTFSVLTKVWVEGYSIKAAAKSVGITGWGASQRIKRLAKNQLIIDLLEKYRLKEINIENE
jgi:RNA polymerase sigma factor (sigma-70 family)